MKNLFFTLKCDLFLVLKAKANDPDPTKKIQKCTFSWRLALQNSSYNNFNRYRNFKKVDFWEKDPNITQISKADITGTV